ncbi:MAG: TetR/AcrR family transcriptional regulator [Trebonia sp.]
MQTVNDSVDPRMVRSRKVMLAAARALLMREGPAAVTHLRVAQEAKVGRATVYRHWPRPDLLLLDAMGTVELPFFREPVTPVRPWLRGQLRVLADEMAIPAVAAVALAMMQGPAPGRPAEGRAPTEVRDGFLATATGRLDAAFTLAAANGELDVEVDPQDAVALLMGPLLHRTVFQGATVSDDLIERMMDSVGTWRLNHKLPCTTTPLMFLPATRSAYPWLTSDSEYREVTSSSSLSVPAW